MKGNELFICNEMRYAYKDPCFSYKELSYYTSYSYKEKSYSYKEMSYLYIQKRVIHTRQWILHMYFHQRDWVIHERKWASHIQGNELFIQWNRVFIVIYIYIHRNQIFTWVIHKGEWVIHTRTWVMHARKWVIQKKNIYMGVIDERGWVIQMGYSFARKWVFNTQGNELYIQGNMFSYKEMNYLYESFIQGTELFIRIIHTRKGVINSYTRKWVLHIQRMSSSYIQENELFIWVIHTRNCVFSYQDFCFHTRKWFFTEMSSLYKWGLQMKGHKLFKWDIHMQGNEFIIHGNE